MNRKDFYDHLRKSIFKGHLNPTQVDGMEQLLNVWNDYYAKYPLDMLAYSLATSFHETAGEMQPIYERGSRAYFNKYEPGTKLGKVLGNTQPGDGYRFRGAGHVQNTGRANAERATRRLNERFNLRVDLVDQPELRLDPFVSAHSLFLGMIEGWYTGKDLDDYLDGVDESDAEDLREYIESRRTVNGVDKAKLIGEYALTFEAALKVAGHKPRADGAAAPSTKKPWWQVIIEFLQGLFKRSDK